MTEKKTPRIEKRINLDRIKSVGKKALALAEIAGVAVVGVATMSGNAQAAESARQGTSHSASAIEKRDNPQKVADKVIFSMNNDPNSPYQNRVISEVYVMEPGTFVNTGPVASAETSSTPTPGAKRLKKNEYDEVILGRRVKYGGHEWLVGVENDGKRTLNAINTANMKWYNLDTARYKRYGFPDPANPRAYIKPELLAAQMDPDANLQLVNNDFRTLPGVMPPMLALDISLHESWSTLQSQLDAQGFMELKASEPNL